MNGIDILIEEHKYVTRMLKVIRRVCFSLMEYKEINYEDFENIIKFIRNFADGHHHRKEEEFLFNKMVECLGDAGKNAITHGMLVEHDLGRMYVRNLEEAINKFKGGNEESKLDIIGNAISYTTLLENHIHKEDNVIFTFAQRRLDEKILSVVNEECKIYEEKNSSIREEYISILKALEEKYI